MSRRISSQHTAVLLAGAADHSPAYAGIAERLRLLISDGRIPVGTQLPSERELTGALGVSRTTVTRAYATLKDAGYLEARHGSGSRARVPHAGHAMDALLSPGSISPDLVNLSCAAPTAPPGVTAAYEWAVSQLPGYLTELGYYPTGVPALRQAIADRYAARGLPTEADQILVTSGGLSALSIVIAAFVDAGDRVLMESPTYPNAVAALRGAGARVHGADVGEAGWATSSLSETVRQLRPRLAYLMPDWHNPTGMLMNDEQRQGLAQALRSARTLAVVDETMAELAIDEVEMPLPFAAHLPSTITLGSASKTFWGGLRIGWVRAPADRMAELMRARLTMDLGAPVVEQLALLHLTGHLDQVLAVRREQLAASRAALVSALAVDLPGWCFRVPGGGLSLWCELPRAASSALVVAAEQRGVRLAAGPLFAPEGGLERFLRLPYTQPPELLTSTVGRLAEAWEATGRSTRRTPPRSPALVT